MNENQFAEMMAILHAILQSLLQPGGAAREVGTSFDVYPLTPSPDQMLAQLQSTERELAAEQSRRREILQHVNNIIGEITPKTDLQEKSYKILLHWIDTI